MELWSCTVFCAKNGDKILLGIFSDKEKARTQAHVFMMDEGDLFEMTDHANEVLSDETLYYQTKHTNEKFIFYIERYILDELSY